MFNSLGLWMAALAPEAQKSVEHQLLDTIRLWLIMLALHIPVYVAWGWVLFRHWDDFWNAIAFWNEPQYLSMDDKEYWYDAYGTAKLAAWFFAPIGLVAFEIRLLGW